MMKAPYFSAFNVTHAFMRDMLGRNRGVIIHVNSPVSIFTWPSCTGYAAARWALRGLHESLCQDLRGYGSLALSAKLKRRRPAAFGAAARTTSADEFNKSRIDL